MTPLLKGSNKIVLNKATVVAAVQEFLDKRTVSGITLGTIESVVFNEIAAEANFSIKEKTGA